MKAIILAAGMGNRLGDYTKNNTKAMVEVNGIKLIERTLNSLHKFGVNEVVIVVGYKKDNLVKFVLDNYQDMNIKFIENNDYSTTNNIYSLYLAKEELNDDIILLESDIIFEENVIRNLLCDPEKNIVLVDKYERWMDGTVTLIDENNNITKFLNKSEFDWKQIKYYYKTVNIYKLSKEFIQSKYIPFLEAHIKSEGMNSYYEQVLKVITQLDSVKLKAKIIKGYKWYEIDDVQDLDIASVIFNENSITNLGKRYGGYWRFTKLIDYCYLVNPYFPTEVMNEEIKASFDELVASYPSGMKVQRFLAAKMFDCNMEEIVVGNGAAELINALSKSLSGKVMVIDPTFNEYAERFKEDRVIHYNTEKNNYKYSINDIIMASEDADNVILINPDNPSGHYFSKDEVLSLASKFRENDKSLILDESFVDFAGDNYRFTLIDSEILEQNKNLVVIKSISKSYGVPGLRLGVLASANSKLVENIANEISIWNINSLAEYFMQIIGKHKKDYDLACQKISVERDRMFEELNKIPYLEVLPSRSNYFLCKLKGINSKKLCETLLRKHNILIKSCSSKRGFSEDNYVRIAVRNREDNKRLIIALKSLIK